MDVHRRASHLGSLARSPANLMRGNRLDRAGQSPTRQRTFPIVMLALVLDTCWQLSQNHTSRLSSPLINPESIRAISSSLSLRIEW